MAHSWRAFWPGAAAWSGSLGVCSARSSVALLAFRGRCSRGGEGRRGSPVAECPRGRLGSNPEPAELEGMRGDPGGGPRRASDPSTGPATGDTRRDHDEDRRNGDADDPPQSGDAACLFDPQRGGEVVPDEHPPMPQITVSQSRVLSRSPGPTNFAQQPDDDAGDEDPENLLSGASFLLQIRRLSVLLYPAASALLTNLSPAGRPVVLRSEVCRRDAGTAPTLFVGSEPSSIPGPFSQVRPPGPRPRLP